VNDRARSGGVEVEVEVAVEDNRVMAGLPPGPRMPVALQTAIWVRSAQWLMDQCARRFGDTFQLRVANQGSWIVLSNPADVEAVFKGDPQVLFAGEGNEILAPILGSHSVLLLDGPAHLDQRKLLLPAFHGERMAGYGELMREIAAREIDSWPQGSTQLLRPRMQAITLEVILRAVLGVTNARRREELRTALRDLLDMLTDPKWGSLFLVLGPERLPYFPPFRSAMARVDELLYAEIADRRRADITSRVDIMSMLCAATHDDGSPMSDGELRDELLTLLVAGHETTANALAWACERLARHPDKLVRLSQEVRDGQDGYLKAVIYETLRLRPVIAVVQRVLKAPMAIAGYEIPASMVLTVSITLVNRRPEVYRDPDAFWPERFLDQQPGTYTWIPFGGGVRRCLGAAFAQFEMETVLRELVARTSIRPVRVGAEPVQRRAVTETPRHNAEVVVG
jgi:cytochrome P450